MLRVSDTGVGIAADDLPFVTQRFFRGKSGAMVSGSGIGLAIVDQVVQLHHGHMEIASEPGRGTQVTVMLPRAENATP
jgi:signal transduction histidine kinase